MLRSLINMRRLFKCMIAAAMIIITTTLCHQTAVEDFDLAAGDLLRRLAGKTRPPSNVVVIAIDEASYNELGVSFGELWPRALHAKLLRRLNELRVASVAFDVLFTGPGAKPDEDRELAEAFALNKTTIGVEVSRVMATADTEIERVDRPFDEFAKVTTEALVNFDMNTRDGRIRNFPDAKSAADKGYPLLSFAAAGVADHPEWQLPRQRDMIKYYGSARENARIISYWEMFQKMAPSDEARFRDAVVFVGLLLRSDTGPAQKDSYFSPFGDEMIFGVEIHAAIAGNLIQQSWIRRPSRIIEVAVQSLTAAAISLTALSISPIMLTYIVTAIVVTWVVAGFLLMKSGVFLAGAATILLILPAMVLVSAVTSYLAARRSAEEARQREEAIRAAFALYVSPDVLPKIQSNELSLSLGGENMILTAMFTDIADFTTVSESMPAEQTSQMLNAYFTEVMDVVFANQGTLLKFIGDAIFAIWGAPVKVDNHAELALQTAKAIQDGVERFNASKRFPPLVTRIGVHTGPMLVGNLGSSKRFDYTAIGDSVNLASRIEGLNKYLGTTILFSEATREAVGCVHGSIPIASVVVKGRSESVLLHSFFDPPLPEATSAEWAQALKEFKSRDFDAAKKRFQQIIKAENRLAGAAQLYIDQLSDFICTQPGPDWSGAIEFHSK
ncbi:MAG: CHASE2 domain-containing protein [Pseudomonadota bacterium]|jgi:adenylate cyclase